MNKPINEDLYEPVGTMPQEGDTIVCGRDGATCTDAKAGDQFDFVPDGFRAGDWYMDEDGIEDGGWRILKRKRTYLSGPMTGYPDHNFPAFTSVAAALRAGGRTVFNPAESFDGKTDLSRREYFQHDFTELAKCSEVALLPGWEKSEGALSEVFAALQMQLPIFRVVGATHQLESVLPFEIMDAIIEFGIRWMEGKTVVVGAADLGFGEAITSETILEEAARLTSGDRNKDYGHPLDDYAKTGTIWGALLHTWAKEAAKHEYPIPVPADLACLLMVGVKLSRQVNRRKRDNLVDGAGYLRCVEMIEDEQERRNAER